MFDDPENESPAEKRWGEISESSHPPEMAAWKVLRFLRGRGGFADWLDGIDDETQIEIIDGVVNEIAQEMGL